jgi:hypothetical protein
MNTVQQLSWIAVLAKMGSTLLFLAAFSLILFKVAKQGTMPRLGLSRENNPAGFGGIAALLLVLAVLFYQW